VDCQLEVKVVEKDLLFAHPSIFSAMLAHPVNVNVA